MTGVAALVCLLPARATAAAVAGPSSSARVPPLSDSLGVVSAPFYKTQRRGEVYSKAALQSSSTQCPAIVKDPWQLEQAAGLEIGTNGALSREPAVLFDLQPYMAEVVAGVDAALDAAVPVVYPESLHHVMRYSLLGGGKRVSAVVCIATACNLFGAARAAALPVACALEMIHDAALVHDDLPRMDNGVVRRGRPATHVEFGECAAVLSGDALLCRAFDLIARESPLLSAESALRVIALIAGSVGSKGMVAGQVVDLLSTADPSVAFETLEYIHLHKTAALVKSAAMCGAIVGGAADDEVEILGEFGLTLGLLIQVVDDVVDAKGFTQELGKRVGVDATAAKPTFPKLLGMEKTKLYVDEVADRARAQLSRFDPDKAAPLAAIVENMRTRAR